jgi:hypothetical protein
MNVSEVKAVDYRRALLLAAIVVAAGCRAPATEMLVRVDNGGVAIPDQVEQVRILVHDRTAGTTPYTTPPTPLCAPGQSGGCAQFPLTLTLFPGPHAPEDEVGVEVQALKGDKVVIGDLAVFTFTQRTRQQLDFVLYPACLGKECSQDARAGYCDESGQCAPLTLGHDDAGMGDDLAGQAAADMALAADLSLADASAADLATADLRMSCAPERATDTQYVDPTLGTNDAAHGGGGGTCAYSTLTYALAHAGGTISLANAVYSSETFPIVLNDNQQLVCNGATLQGFGNPPAGSAPVTLILAGAQTRASNCTIATGNGNATVDYGIHILKNSNPSNAVIVDGCTINDTYANALVVDNGQTVQVTNNLLGTAPFHTTVVFNGGNAGMLANNRFVGASVNNDVICTNDGSPNLSGNGNTSANASMGVQCANCTHCPFK